MQEVPAQSHLQVEMAQVEIDGEEFCLRLVVTDIVVQIAIGIDVNIVSTERREEQFRVLYKSPEVWHEALELL